MISQHLQIDGTNFRAVRTFDGVLSLSVTGKNSTPGSWTFIKNFLLGAGDTIDRAQMDVVYTILPNNARVSVKEAAMRWAIGECKKKYPSLKVDVISPIVGVGATCVVLRAEISEVEDIADGNKVCRLARSRCVDRIISAPFMSTQRVVAIKAVTPGYLENFAAEIENHTVIDALEGNVSPKFDFFLQNGTGFPCVPPLLVTSWV